MKSLYTRPAALAPLKFGATLVLASCMALSVQAAWAAEEDALPIVRISGNANAAGDIPSPATTASISARQLEETSNVMTVEDALKYLPSVLVRKRFDGDTGAPVATRTTGINASARSLILADGVLLSALVNNNNGNGSPRWFMVAPEEIDSIDVLYGPYSAAYAGNSYGAVVKLNTRMPRQFEASVKLSAASQKFSEYATHERYRSQDLSATVGNRSGALSWFVSAKHLDSHSQPISFGTLSQSSKAAVASDPTLSGAYPDLNRSNGAIQVIGAGNITHTVQDSAKLKLAYEFSPALSAVYTLGYWHNDADASASSYLSTAGGAPYYGASSGNVNINGKSYSASSVAGQFSATSTEQQHLMQSLDLRSRQAAWDWNLVASHYRYGTDLSRSSSGVFPAAQTGGAGRSTDASGTGWSTLDLNGSWRPDGVASAHVLRFGLHGDQFKLVSPSYNSLNWTAGDQASLFSSSLGKTRTTALWLQDQWRMAPALTATLGARYEQWRAFDGYNYAIASSGKGYAVNQPAVDRKGLSPKASLAWKLDPQWQATASFGKALRFPTVGELYQNVQTGATYTQANPFLQPENVKSGELALEYAADSSKLRASLFEEHVRDALISQTSLLSGYSAPVSFTQNVDQTRQRGIELVGERQNALISGLDLNGSLTWVDARITANSSYVATVAGARSVGARTPYVPEWRATAMATYRPTDRWAITVAARYSGKQYGTVDNSDVNGHTYTGFEGFMVADLRLHYQLNRQWSLAGGVNNLNNRNYYLYHPFPQRTVFTELKFNY